MTDKSQSRVVGDYGKMDTKGHVWARTKDGDVDEWLTHHPSVHLGPTCERCGYSFWVDWYDEPPKSCKDVQFERRERIAARVILSGYWAFFFVLLFVAMRSVGWI